MLTATTYSFLFEQIIEQPFWNDIISSFFSRKADKQNFQNHLIIEVSNVELGRLNDAITHNYINYLIARIASNQVKSGNSRWHKNERIFASDLDMFITQLCDDCNHQDLHAIIKEAIAHIISNANTRRNKQLTEIQHRCFTLYYYHGNVYQEIADKLNINIATVYSSVKKFEEKIKKQIKKMNYE